MSEKALIVTPWHRREQLEWFLQQWGVQEDDPRFVFQQDVNREGCGATKNKGVDEAVRRGADIVIVIDDDCSIHQSGRTKSVDDFIAEHVAALQPQKIPLLKILTDPPARGNPYFNRTVNMEVAAAVGWWHVMADRDAARQLIEGVEAPMKWERGIVYGRPVVLCGMNISFRPARWYPWCKFIHVSRMDDIFQSWLWCRQAARMNACFNFNAPDVDHRRQSAVFASLRDEAKYLEQNENLWSDIWMHPATDYETLRALVPVP